MRWQTLYSAEGSTDRLSGREIMEYIKADCGINSLRALIYSLEDPFSESAQTIIKEISTQEAYRKSFFETRIKKLIDSLSVFNWVDNWDECNIPGTILESEIIRAVILELRSRGDLQQSKFDYITRGSTRYTAWRWSVLLRDNFTCQKCGKRADLEAHHIVPYHENKELATDVNNGLTLCKDCHKAHHSENGYKTKGAFA
jgi:hypothetical protein